ncbi:MAG: 3-deoxy-manno-octulosonate cytidylyltransferase [bacterium]
MKNTAVIIPARLGATRFPGKLLHPILGKPLILWVVRGASESKLATEIIVATDDERIFDIVKHGGFEARITRSDHPSGTDRVREVAEKLDCDLIVNVQGDEPLITGDVIDNLISAAVSGKNSEVCEMATIVSPLDPGDAENPNRVKVVFDSQMNALYFSRSKIPYLRFPPDIDSASYGKPVYYLHVGVYLYRNDILSRMVSLPRGFLESIEGLEQLRALENGIRIRCVETKAELFSVDSIGDVPKVEAALRARGYTES